MAKKKKALNDNAVIYARYSSHRQTEMSIEQQLVMCRKLADDNGLTVIEEYADRAISGKTDKRPDFQKMMRRAVTGDFGYVLAWKSNRIGRNMLEALVNQERLTECGVRILYVEEDFDDTAAGRFAMRSMMNVNQFYSENMAEDIVRGMRSNAEKCMVTSGQAPLGFKFENKRYLIDKEGAETVREIYDRFLLGENCSEIARALNAEGKRSATGAKFAPNSFTRILRNERYRGVYIWDDIRIEGGLPQIIDDRTFYKVQELIESQERTRHRHTEATDYMLTGKLFCGECGSAMTGTHGTSHNGSKHYYYKCKKNNGSCKKKPIKKDYIEKAVAQVIKDNVLQPDVIEWICDQAEEYAKSQAEQNDTKRMIDEMEECKKGIANLINAVQSGLKLDAITQRIEELSARKKELEDLLTVAAALQYSFRREDAYAWLDQYKNGEVDDPEFCREIFKTFLKKVYVYDDGRVKVVVDLHGGETQEITLSDLSDDDVRFNSPIDHQSLNSRTQAVFVGGFLVIFASLRKH